MTGDDMIPLLGKPAGDPAVTAFLATLGIAKVPKLKRRDDTTVVGNNALGIEVTFRDERSLDVKSDAYDEGDLVLSNVRLYGPGYSSFSAFTDALPLGLRFDLGPAETAAQIGSKPAWSDRELAKSRWDLGAYCVFVTFEKKVKGTRNVSIQLPVA